MGLSREEIKRQREAAARAAKNKKDAEARRAASLNTTRTRLRAEAEAKAKKEKDRLISEYQTRAIWGAGEANRKKMRNDLRYVESQRVKEQDAITNAQNKTKPAAKPAVKPTAKAPKNGDTTIKEGNKFVFNNGQWTLAPKPAAKPQTTTNRPAGTQPSRPAASRPAAPAAPAKPAAPASPKDRRVSAATANRESGNYGTSRTNNPMIDDAMKARMRQREQAQAGASGSSKPEDKSKYVASDGRPYKGPAFGNDPKPSSSVASKKPAEKGMTLAERMRKRRQGLA